MRRVAALIAAATPAVATDAALRGLVLEALREAMENPWKTHGNHIQHHQRIEHISNIEQEYYMCIVDPTFAPKNLPLGATCLLVQK